MTKDVLRIEQSLCIDCGLCRQSCPFSAVVCSFEKRHRYEILPHTCEWCGGVGTAPCEVYCPVPGAIVPSQYAAAVPAVA